MTGLMVVFGGICVALELIDRRHQIRHWWRERRIARNRARAVNEYVRRVRSS